MTGFEFAILVVSCLYTYRSILGWYRKLPSKMPVRRDWSIKLVMGLLPLVSLYMILYTLTVLASFDVVNNLFFIFFYTILGYAWTFLGLNLVFMFFDISWIDDVLNSCNKAALYAISGAFLGLVVIYSGANIGDGPGWWCVIFAGGLGLAVWILLARLLNLTTHIFERITVERNIFCGIRFGAYLLASGIILARASAGDWTSFGSTIIEFFVGWPAILLTVLAVLIERYYIYIEKSNQGISDLNLFGSLFWGIVYIVIAVYFVMQFPFVENPMYGIVSAVFQGAVL